MLIGHARVSIDDQNLELQRAALGEAGCTRICEEKLSGANRNRPELVCLLDHLRGGDVVIVYRLDRLARSTRDLLEIAEQLKEADAGLRSLSEPWADTTSPANRMVLTVAALILAPTVCSLPNGSSRALLKVWMVSGAERPRISTTCGLASWKSAPARARRSSDTTSSQ
jgi:resolvase-like protein